MAEKIIPIETEVGIISGRDAIYLHSVQVLNETKFTLQGQFMGFNCSKIETDIELKFSITFQGVLLFKMIELDFDDVEYESCFDLIQDSEKLASLRARDTAAKIGKIDRGYNIQANFSNPISHQHFVFRTYDTVFELIAQNYDLTIEI